MLRNDKVMWRNDKVMLRNDKVMWRNDKVMWRNKKVMWRNKKVMWRNNVRIPNQCVPDRFYFWKMGPIHWHWWIRFCSLFTDTLSTQCMTRTFYMRMFHQGYADPDRKWIVVPIDRFGISQKDVVDESKSTNYKTTFTAIIL